MKASFETARLSLSLVRVADRAHLVALERDPEVMRFLNLGRHTPDDGAKEGAGFLTPPAAKMMSGLPSRRVQAPLADGSRSAMWATGSGNSALDSAATPGVGASLPRAPSRWSPWDSRTRIWRGLPPRPWRLTPPRVE